MGQPKGQETSPPSGAAGMFTSWGQTGEAWISTWHAASRCWQQNLPNKCLDIEMTYSTQALLSKSCITIKCNASLGNMKHDQSHPRSRYIATLRHRGSRSVHILWLCRRSLDLYLKCCSGVDSRIYPKMFGNWRDILYSGPSLKIVRHQKKTSL